MDSGADGLRAGQLVGAWRLGRSLGSGGMGEVWLAERAATAFQRIAYTASLETAEGALREGLVGLARS